MNIKQLAASLFISASFLTAPVFADDSAAAISAAKEAQKKASSVGGEWRDIGKFIKKAEEAAKSGDAKKAMKLANKAKAQAENGYKQAMAESTISEFPAYMK